MIELTLLMENKENSEDVRNMKILVNPESFQMIYPEDAKCAILFSTGRSIVVEESYGLVKDMISQTRMVVD